MGRLLPILLLIGLTIFSLVVVAQSDPGEVRHLPRWLWFVLVLVVPGIGLLCWWIFGRPTGEGDGRPARPVAPDDDPDFLRRL
ncbi:MAG: PLD nuclease N-terminal domain-containing protein [Propionibacteriaceae bacterium]|nr:PLD nuclease N-terminal domain-containing protein [Propionibacteriaceae bacterium]